MGLYINLKRINCLKNINDDLNELEKRKTVGYNLFATKAKEFMSHLKNG